MASGEFSDDDARRLQSWLAEDERHIALLERERATWQALVSLRGAFTAAGGVEAPRIGVRRRRQAWPRLAAAVAAGLLIALLLPSALTRLQADHRAGAAVAHLALEDGTRIVLDAGSAVDIDYTPDQRRVRLLQGAAWFEVAHGDARPFEVVAQRGRVRDIGTAFAVRLDGDDVRTSVSEGEVEVHGRVGGVGVQLRAGQGISFHANGTLSARHSIPVEDIAPWRNGEILLEGVPLEEALRQVARYRSRPVWVAGDLSQAGRITAVFSTADPDEAIATLVRMHGLESQTLPGGVLLIRR